MVVMTDPTPWEGDQYDPPTDAEIAAVHRFGLTDFRVKLSAYLDGTNIDVLAEHYADEIFTASLESLLQENLEYGCRFVDGAFVVTQEALDDTLQPIEELIRSFRAKHSPPTASPDTASVVSEDQHRDQSSPRQGDP